MARLAAKVALVTGAASGIGRATAELFAREGAAVAVTDANVAGAREVAMAIEQAGGRALAFGLDVMVEADWKNCLAGVRALWGAPHLLVANAGVSLAEPVTAMTLEQWRRVMAVNLDGVFLGIRHTLPAIRERGAGGIIIVSSASGIKAAANASAYCASKAALLMLARCVVLECKERGDAIRVNTVLPGGVKTAIWRDMPFFRELVDKTGSEEAAFAAMGHFSEPDEIARAILFLAGDEAGSMTGGELVIDGGYTA